MSSRDDNQLLGKEVDLDTLKSNCGNKTMDGDKILNPCGSIANSLFNDVLTLIPPSFNESLRLDEHGIAWKYDLLKFKNPDSYGDPKYKWLYCFRRCNELDMKAIPISFPRNHLMIPILLHLMVVE